MINEERVRQMMKLAVYDEDKKSDKRPQQYFRRDYIAYEMIKSFFFGSIGFVLMVFLIGIYWHGVGVSNKMFWSLVILAMVSYVVFIGGYLALTYWIYSERYEAGRKTAKEYQSVLKRVNEIYEQEEAAKTIQELD